MTTTQNGRRTLMLAALAVLALGLLLATGCKCSKDAPPAQSPQATQPAEKTPAPAPTEAKATAEKTVKPAEKVVETPAEKPLNDWSVVVTEIGTGSDTGKKTRTLQAFEKEGVVTLMDKVVEDKDRAGRLATLVKGSDWAEISGLHEGEVAEDPVYTFVVTVKGRAYEFKRNRLDGSAIEVLRLLQFFLN